MAWARVAAPGARSAAGAAGISLWAQARIRSAPSPGGGSLEGRQRKPARLRAPWRYRNRSTLAVWCGQPCTAAKRTFGMAIFGPGRPSQGRSRPRSMPRRLKGLDQICKAIERRFGTPSGGDRCTPAPRRDTARYFRLAGLDPTGGGTKAHPPRVPAGHKPAGRNRSLAHHLRCCRAIGPQHQACSSPKTPFTPSSCGRRGGWTRSSSSFLQAAPPILLPHCGTKQAAFQFLGPR